MLERCTLCHGNVHSADGWRYVLDPVIARYADRNIGGRFFRADAAYAITAIYARLEEAGYFYAIRLDGDSFVELLLGNSSKLSPRYRSIVPLRQIYVPDLATP
jgi:hypothetical protein